jgi:DNA polymerase-1
MKINNKNYNIKIWNGQKLDQFIALDTETTMVPFHKTPELVTCQVYAGGEYVYFVPKSKLNVFFNRHYNNTFICHNASFDLDVLEREIGRDKTINIYDECRIKDTSVMYRLLHLASIGFVPFKYSLAFLAKKYLNIEIEGKGDIQCDFSRYLDHDLKEIPDGHLEYAAMDAVVTYHVYYALLSLTAPYDTYGTGLSHDIQVKGERALTHIRKNGIKFDLEKRDIWLNEKRKELSILSERLATWGWVRGTKGIKKRYEDIVSQLGIADQLPRTEDGSISSKSEDLEEYNSLPFISDYLQYVNLEKATSFVRDIDSERIHPKYNSILNTGRTSCSKPNFQQLPRIGGIREMFIADKDKTFIITDYSTLELCTLSQVLLNQYKESTMGDLINEGRDLHRYYASVLHGRSERDITKQERQEAKAANFGFPGGLGSATFRKFSAGYGLDLSESQAQSMKDAWFNAFPEMREYLNNEQGYVYTITGRRRGNTTYCAEKNTPFQGLAADGAKLALYNLDKAGFKIVGFVHDEIICEVPTRDAEKLLLLQEDIMVNSMQMVVPSIKISVESQISERYCK